MRLRISFAVRNDGIAAINFPFLVKERENISCASRTVITYSPIYLFTSNKKNGLSKASPAFHFLKQKGFTLTYIVCCTKNLFHHLFTVCRRLSPAAGKILIFNTLSCHNTDIKVVFDRFHFSHKMSHCF